MSRISSLYDPGLVPFYRERKRKRRALAKIFVISLVAGAMTAAVLGPLALALVNPVLGTTLGRTAFIVTCITVGWFSSDIGIRIARKRGLVS